jgi:hypothetical protein
MTPSPCKWGLYFPPIHGCPVVTVRLVVIQNSTNLVVPVFEWMFYEVSIDTSLHTKGITLSQVPSPFTCVPKVMYCLRKYREKYEK